MTFARGRILPHGRGDGPENMAIDEALLESVVRRPDASVIRTYEWSTPTLTLGYFQPRALWEADERWKGVPIARRATGGGAIWHDREITYSIVIPPSHPLARRHVELYHAVHAALIDHLRERGISADRRADVEPTSKPGPDRPLLCFLDRDPEDVLIAGSKIIGSAQRRRAGAVLQHGSILLGTSPRTPELPGLARLASDDASIAAWAQALRRILPRVLEVEPFEDELTAEERSDSLRLEREHYRNPAWNDRR